MNTSTQCQGIRGATTAPANTREAILATTRELLQALREANDFAPEEIAAIWFTTTSDLIAAYPAAAARELGWTDAAMLCGHEMAVPDGLPQCIRVLILWNTPRAADQIRHVYLREAARLRPDRAQR